MQPETPKGETPVVTDPKTNANPTPPAPQVPSVDTAEVERLRKEAEQATMRANQLANQLKAKEDAEAEAKAKELEEQNKYKDLFEQEKAKRQEIEAAKEKADRDTAIKAEQDKVFSEYPDEVKSLAEEVGLNLTDTEDDTIAAFKSKLDNISSKIKAPKVTPNNPGNQAPKTDLTPQETYEMLRDPVKFSEYMRKNSKGVASMMRPVA